MMSVSPGDQSSEVIKLSLFADGRPFDESVKIISVTVNKAINRIPYSKIVLIDGDIARKKFPVSDSDDLKPGVKIKVNVGYGDNEETVYEGIIIKHGIKISSDNNSRLVIECRDEAVAMTVARKSQVYNDKKDSEIIQDIIREYKIDCDVDYTDTTYKQLVQYYCTDWDFILSRAEINGHILVVNNGKIHVGEPDSDNDCILKVTYGDDLIEFQADLDAKNQLSHISCSSWNPAEQMVVEEMSEQVTLNNQGNIDVDELAKVLNIKSYKLQTPVMLEKSALLSWAAGQSIKSGLSRIRGKMKFQGNARALPGSIIKVEGVGDRFNGDVFVSAVNHEIKNGDWVSEVEFGISSDWFSEQRDLVAPSASGMLPGIEGLHIGVVNKLDEDPESMNRVQVIVPLLQSDVDVIWARLANIYASDGFGAYFVPEIGDEVILGFMNNDPGNPVILGSLYSSKRTPPYESTAENYMKAIVTKSELKIEFDDEKKVITIVTPEANKLVINDDEQSILIQDQNNNKLELSSSGIALDSPKDISITAKGNITIDATSNLSMSSKSDVTLEGMNVNQSAKAGFTAKGNASAELSASGQTTVKGAMVMIN